MTFKQGLVSNNSWKRVLEENVDNYTPDFMLYIQHLARKRPKFLRIDENKYLDIHTKRAAHRVSPSVVAVVSYTGEEELNQCSGTIIEEIDSYVGMVLTSANLIRSPIEEETTQNAVADDLKVIVISSDGKRYEGEVCVHDFHYNLVIIRFKLDCVISCATLRHVDDCLDMNLHNIVEETSASFKLVPGASVIILGRYFSKPFELMAAPGKFCLERCEYDCKELCMSTCRMTRCGDGGPVINTSGEVIGVAFYQIGSTPFMPINIALKWWEHYKKYDVLLRPCMGMDTTNFYTADLSIAEKVIRRCPNVSNGVIVEKVIQGSSAHSAGLRVNDVIIRCNGRAVRSFLGDTW